MNSHFGIGGVKGQRLLPHKWHLSPSRVRRPRGGAASSRLLLLLLLLLQVTFFSIPATRHPGQTDLGSDTRKSDTHLLNICQLDSTFMPQRQKVAKKRQRSWFVCLSPTHDARFSMPL